MTLTSKMAAAEDGLLALMLADGTLGAISQLGDPRASPPPEVAWIQENATADWATDVTATASSGGSFEEVYELHVRILTTVVGENYLTLRNRARDLGAALETLIGSNRTLGGAVGDSYVVKVERSSGATDVGRGMQIDVTIHCWNYLT